VGQFEAGARCRRTHSPGKLLPPCQYNNKRCRQRTGLEEGAAAAARVAQAVVHKLDVQDAKAARVDLGLQFRRGGCINRMWAGLSGAER